MKLIKLIKEKRDEIEEIPELILITTEGEQITPGTKTLR